MKNWNKFIESTVNEYLNEQEESNLIIKDILIKRIPFLKEYNVVDHPRYKNRLVSQRTVNNSDVEMMMGDKIIKFKEYNIVSEITYYDDKIGNNIFHYFSVLNKLYPRQPEDMDNLLWRIFIIAKKDLEQRLSYHKEIRIKEDEEFPKNELDKIINDMNGCLFKIEEFTKKHSIDLF